MLYAETVQWMFQQLPMYQKSGQKAYKADLSNTQLLVKHLGNPQNGFKSVHVGGTNGKGSTCHILTSVLIECGYKVGLYTSPHLKDFRERIKINGQMINRSFVVDFIKTNKTFFIDHQLSFFEMTVGMAFSYFKNQCVDVAFIEVGLGGRLDSTNVITPLVSVITNIGYDHMQFLGNTLEKIAFEKAGIIKPSVPVVIGEVLSETKPVFQTKAENEGSEIFFAEGQELPKGFSTDLLGNYQNKNLKTAYTTLKVLQEDFDAINEETILRGFNRVVKNTGFKGRWQILNKKPLIIADTAHNREGLIEVLNQLSDQKYNQLLIVLGFVSDKDVKQLLSLFPKNARYFYCSPKISRALSLEELELLSSENGLTGQKFTSVQKALEAAKSVVKDEDLIFVGGSTFVVSEVI